MKAERSAQRQLLEQRVLRTAKAWFDALKPSGWLAAKHLYAPRCNTTTDQAEALAVAVAKLALYERKQRGR